MAMFEFNEEQVWIVDCLYSQWQKPPTSRLAPAEGQEHVVNYWTNLTIRYSESRLLVLCMVRSKLSNCKKVWSSYIEDRFVSV